MFPLSNRVRSQMHDPARRQGCDGEDGWLRRPPRPSRQRRSQLHLSLCCALESSRRDPPKAPSSFTARSHEAQPAQFESGEHSAALVDTPRR